MFGADLTSARWTGWYSTEWARTAEDVLWRRSKLGLRFRPAEIEALASYLTHVPVASAEPP